MQLVVTILTFSAVPLLVVGIAWLVRTWYASARRPRKPERPEFVPSRDGPPLSATRADEVCEVPVAARVREDADRVRADVQRAHLGASLAYASIVVWAYIAYTSQTFDDNVRFAIGYGILAPQVLILLWEIRLPHRRRVLVFLLYATTGVALLLLTAQPARAGKIALYVGVVAVLPVGALLAAFIRWFRLLLIPLTFVTVPVIAFGIPLERYGFVLRIETAEAVGLSPWLAVVIGVTHVVVVTVVAFLCLRQRWPIRALGIAAGLLAAALLERDLVRQSLPDAVRFICLAILGVTTILIMWMPLRFFIWLSTRRNSTNALMLCWALVSCYYVASTYGNDFYANPEAVRHGVVLALVAHFVLLHIVLFRIRRHRPPLAAKRLLLLGVFGGRRDSLLDDLSDIWRQIGAVDLLALQTLELRILAALWLLPEDDRVLYDEQEIDARIGRHRSQPDAEARYPVNALYCGDDSWPHAFRRLAEGANVVLMDLRGFSTRNEGCTRELRALLRQEQRPPMVVLVKSPEDLEAVGGMVAGTPRDFTVLHFHQRSAADRRALFTLLLNGAFGS